MAVIQREKEGRHRGEGRDSGSIRRPSFRLLVECRKEGKRIKDDIQDFDSDK